MSLVTSGVGSPYLGGQRRDTIRLSRLPDVVRVSRKARREAIRAARVDAARGWLPGAEGEEPEHCLLIDHAHLVAAAKVRLRADAVLAGLVATMSLFATLPPGTGPAACAVGPEARRQAEEAQRYRHLSFEARYALSSWELACGRLHADLRSRDALRRATRATYAAELAARHPHPERLPRLDGVADLCLRQAPDQPTVVTELRRRFGGLP